MKIKSKKSEYVRLNLSSLISSLEKTFKIYVPPFRFGDEQHVFEGVKPMKKSNGFTMKKIISDENARLEVFEPFENAGGISTSDIEWLVSFAIGAGMIEGKNFIVDIDCHLTRFR